VSVIIRDGVKREMTSKNSATVMCSKCVSSSLHAASYTKRMGRRIFSARFDVLDAVTVKAVSSVNPCPTQGDIFLDSGVFCKYGLDEPNNVWY
jgi:hypothetical protein